MAPSPQNEVTEPPSPQEPHQQVKDRPLASNSPADGDIDPGADETTPLIRSAPDVENVSVSRPQRSWWTIIAITILLILTINIIIFAFLVPSAVEDYAKQAAAYSVRNIQIQEYTDSGVISKAQVDITFDASRVSSSGIRKLGVFFANIAKHVYTKPCLVSVLLPQYSGAQVALVGLPELKIDIRNQHPNSLDIVFNITITNETLAVQLAGDVLDGGKSEIYAFAETDIYIRAGIIPLGHHHVEQEIVIRGLFF